jgi:glycosyltransferase involved in cell wall biosynthesis
MKNYGCRLEVRIRYLVPYGPADAAVRERVHRWSDRLRQDGFETVIDASNPRMWHIETDNSETVVVFRHLNSVAQGWPESHALRRASTGIYELDDGLPVDNGNLPDIGVWWKVLFPKSRIARRSAATADRVIVGNETLANWATSYCRDVRIIPTCIQPSEYQRKIDYEIRGVPQIIWIGSAATEVHLTSIADPLKRVHQATGMRLTLIGDPRREVPTPLRDFTDKVAWTPDANALLATADIGIMPLPNRPYEQHKCAYKLLQYGASGLPIVGSPVGMSADVLRACQAMRPETADEWVEALTAEIEAPAATRASKGQSAFSHVTTEFSFDRWHTAYREAITGASAP